MIPHSNPDSGPEHTRAYKMASTLAFVIFVSVVSVTFSLPILQDVKQVQLFEDETPPIKRTPVIGAEITLSVEEEIKHVRSLTKETVFKVFESGEAGKRIRRDITKSKVLCPSNMIRYGNACLTKEQYDDYNDISDGSDD